MEIYFYILSVPSLAAIGAGLFLSYFFIAFAAALR